jgi:hypothetical protein
VATRSVDNPCELPVGGTLPGDPGYPDDQ